MAELARSEARGKPLPLVDIETRPFWEGCARGMLLLQRCSGCGAYRHPPSPICPECLAPEHAWVPASGDGTVYSYVVVHRAFHPAWEGEVPYVVAIVELAEGPHLLANVVDAAVDQVSIGMSVSVSFDRASESIGIPKFRPR